MLKIKTGLTPNILARFAICMSLKDRSIPNPDEFNQEGSDLTPNVFLNVKFKKFDKPNVTAGEIIFVTKLPK